MKLEHMSRYFISCLFLLIGPLLVAQDLQQEKDTTAYRDRYGIRVGIDLFLPVYSLFSDDTKGFEIVGDYRISRRFYIASELGYRDHTRQEDFFEFTTSGQYIRAGVDYNAYQNWIGMENMIVAGVRYGFSTFSQDVNEYTINADPALPERTVNDPLSYDSLNASWVEIVLGIKVEVLHNVYMGFSFRGSTMISSKEPDNFKNLYVPGFERVYFNDFGFSFNYTLSYLIPFYKK